MQGTYQGSQKRNSMAEFSSDEGNVMGSIPIASTKVYMNYIIMSIMIIMASLFASIELYDYNPEPGIIPGW